MDTILFAFLVLLGQPAQIDDPWADAVLESVAISPNPGFDFPERTLGAPSGGGTMAANNNSVASLGTTGSYLTLAFNTPVTDDPLNPGGLDCIVFSNSFWAGGNPLIKWMEPAFISISRDVNGNGLADDPWYFIPGSRGFPAGTVPTGITNPIPPLAGTLQNPNATDADPTNDGEEFDWGYAELTPTQLPFLDNYVFPDDPFLVGLTPRSGGGDAFDIAWAVDQNGQPADLAAFDFIRLWSFVTGSSAALGAFTPEVDAVADVAPLTDEDADGILDEYETRVAGTDPTRPESTVAALEIPPEDGGSPSGALLGDVADAQGSHLRFYSAGPRSGARSFNATVDILPATDPAPSIPEYIKSPVRREFLCSEADFSLAQIEDAEIDMSYNPLQVSGLDPASLTPFRLADGTFTQQGISSILHNADEHWIRFRTRHPGLFVIAGTALPAEGGHDGELWVDFQWQGAELGSHQFPYNTLVEGVAAAAPAQTIHIKPGHTNERLSIQTPVWLVAEGGPVSIGR